MASAECEVILAV